MNGRGWTHTGAPPTVLQREAAPHEDPADPGRRGRLPGWLPPLAQGGGLGGVEHGEIGQPSLDAGGDLGGHALLVRLVDGGAQLLASFTPKPSVSMRRFASARRSCNASSEPPEKHRSSA